MNSVLAGKQAVFQGSQMQGSQKDEGRFLFDEIVSWRSWDVAQQVASLDNCFVFASWKENSITSDWWLKSKNCWWQTGLCVVGINGDLILARTIWRWCIARTVSLSFVPWLIDFRLKCHVKNWEITVETSSFSMGLSSSRSKFWWWWWRCSRTWWFLRGRGAPGTRWNTAPSRAWSAKFLQQVGEWVHHVWGNKLSKVQVLLAILQSSHALVVYHSGMWSATLHSLCNHSPLDICLRATSKCCGWSSSNDIQESRNFGLWRWNI